jgi:hypothetical protein
VQLKPIPKREAEDQASSSNQTANKTRKRLRTIKAINQNPEETDNKEAPTSTSSSIPKAQLESISQEQSDNNKISAPISSSRRRIRSSNQHAKESDNKETKE